MKRGADLTGLELEGGYVVESLVGEAHDGGWVYAARDRAGGRFAVRCPRVAEDFTAEEEAAAFARWESEASALEDLGRQSTDVERLVAHGFAVARGTRVPYTVFSWLEGEPLDRWAAAQPGPRPASEVVAILAPVFRALGVAHRLGLVHRDVRPGNVWVAYAAGRTTVKLTGFALACHLGRGEPSFEPEHGAPEHWKASYGAFSPATDVFGLALLVVELVSGTAALVGKDATELYLCASDLAKRPTLRARGAQVGEALEAVLLRALAVDPRRRWADAQELWEALRTAMPELTPSPPSVRPPEVSPEGEPRTAPSLPPLPSRPPPVRFGPSAPPRAEPAPAPEPARSGRSTWVIGTVLAMAALGIVGSLVLLPGGDAAVPRATRDAAAASTSAAPPAPLASPASPALATADAAPEDAGPQDAATSGSEAGLASDASTADMLRVPAGAFVMGTDKDGKGDGPAHRVVLTHAFYIDRTEVTTVAYAECLAKGACTPIGVHQGDVVETTWGCNTDKERPNHPVNCVDRAQAAKFCAFAGKRLPTEAEWEYAARGPDLRAYPWGNEAPSTCEQAVLPAVTGACGEKKGTFEVGATTAGKSPFGALDMAGNVWEWVEDAYEPYAATEATDPKVPPKAGSRGVLRGGSWDYSPTSAKTTYRLPFQAQSGNVSIGFRCARDAD